MSMGDEPFALTSLLTHTLAIFWVQWVNTRWLLTQTPALESLYHQIGTLPLVFTLSAHLSLKR